MGRSSPGGEFSAAGGNHAGAAFAVQIPGFGPMLRQGPARAGVQGRGKAMAKGMNKRKEVKKPKKEAAKPAVSVASSNAKVSISPAKAKD